MKFSGFKRNNKSNHIVRRGLALLLAFVISTTLVLPNYATAIADEISPAAETAAGLIAHFSFDDGTVTNSVGNNVVAEIADRADGTDYFGNDGENNYLDLTQGDAYLSLKNTDVTGGILTGLTEMTVEMHIKTNDTSTNWAFFAAPNENSAIDPNPTYLGILLNSKITVERYSNSRAFNPIIDWDTNWHTIKVVFKENKTILSVDETFVAEHSSNYSLADCLGENNVLWFGHASWSNGEGFNGYIDDIKIYNYAKDSSINEQNYIITRGVTDPKNTTVNMFDYWITGQTDNDVQAISSWDVLRGGINEKHLFLFAGSESSANLSTNSSTEVGGWNIYPGAGVPPTQGIVNRTLGVDGYPQLAVEQWLKDGFPNQLPADTYNNEKYTQESLAYLFDPDFEHEGKATYTNVTGLFRVRDDGYYYFRSPETFAELNIDQETSPKESKIGNHITLYNTPWDVIDNANGNRGQFFPFNNWSDRFVINQGSGKATQVSSSETMNHYFGMTIETKFQQPTNGRFDYSTKDPMTFEFAGDDDVWLFIDDVLVGDVGGIHGRIRINVDFSTGKIEYYVTLKNDGTGGTLIERDIDTLKEAFDAAGKTDVAWKEVTNNGTTNYIFPDNSIHTLKFYYLERGNAESNCCISFNLQEPLVDRIRKVDENGNPLSGAAFELYNATVKPGVTVNDNEWGHTSSEFEKNGNVITTTESAGDGYALLTNAEGDPLAFSAGNYYILEETETPEGYRSNPPIVLQYHGDSKTFTVVNKYEVGAYASFTTHWTKAEQIYPAEYNPSVGLLTQRGSENNGTINSELEKGLTIVVPVIKQTTGAGSTGDFQRWLPMYGSNTKGWNTITNSYQSTTAGSNTQEQFEKDLALAAFLQIADNDYQDWYLQWANDIGMLEGYMENLPGDASRYGENGDLNLMALLIPEETLRKLGVTGNYANDEERYTALQKALQSALNSYTEETAKKFLDDKYTGIGTNQGFHLLYADDFQQNRGTVIYVTNEQRELRVCKTARNADGSETYLNGAVFAIFDTAEHAAAANTNYESAAAAMTGLEHAVGIQSYGQTASTRINDTLTQDGLLIFRENVPNTTEPDGYAQIIWPSSRTATGNTDTTDNIFWMKEIYAPEGYALNEYLVRIEAGDSAIYANATGYQYVEGQNGAPGSAKILPKGTYDNISVQAELGKLTQTLTKYAIGNNVDVTLQDITITKQTQDGNPENNGAMLTTGNIWTEDTKNSFDLHYGMNAEALTSQYGLHSATGTAPTFTADDGYIRVMPRQSNTRHDTTTKRDDLTYNGTAIPLDGLFDLMNTVVVTDEPLTSGNLRVSKIVSSGETDKAFTFTVTLSDKTINGIYGNMEFKNGVATFKLKHGESITAAGLPAGISYVVDETDNSGYTVTKTGDTGTIEAGKTKEAVFTNTKDGSGSPWTGDSSNISMWLILMGASLLGLIVLFITIKKRGKLQK